MNEIKHRPEPWAISEKGSSILVVYDNSELYVTHMHLITEDERAEEARANAKRIVECVNACAGIEFPENFIKGMREELKSIREIIDADDNESTLDEVERLKARYDKMKIN